MLEDIQERIDRAKAELGETKLAILNEIFDACQDLPDGICAKRFRADRPTLINDMNALEGMHTLIERSRDQERYLVKPYALPLLDTGRAKAILAMADRLLPILQGIYRDRLTGSVSVEEILGTGLGPDDVLLDALYMISEAHGIFGGRSNHFPYESGTTTTVVEDVLQLQSCMEIFSRYYDQHIGNRHVADSFPGMWSGLGETGIESLSILTACSVSSERVDCLEFLDDAEKLLLQEVEVALQKGLFSLSMMGIRALIDYFVQKHVSDLGNFTRSLEVMQAQQIISGRQAKLLEPVFDAGSAAMHRGYVPSKEVVKTCIDVYAHIVRGERHLMSQAESIARQTPPRKRGK